MARVRFMNKDMAKQYDLERYPSFSVTGSIEGMKEKFYGKDALLVRSGSYIYHVPADVYYSAY